MRKLKKFWITFLYTLRRMVRRYSEADMSVYAANAAFYLVVSAVPLIILLLSMVRFIPALNSEHIREALLNLFPEVPMISDAISGIARELEEESTAAVSWISALVMLSSASCGVYAIIQGLWRLYQIPEKTAFSARLAALVHTVVMLLLVVLAIGTKLAARLAVTALDADSALTALKVFMEPVIRVLTYCKFFTVLGTFLLVLSLYLCPFHRKSRIRDQIPGAVFTSIGCFLFSKIFTFYISRFWNASLIYGSLTALILSSFWILILMTVLFLGACLNLALEDLKLPDYLELILKKLPVPAKPGKPSKK